MAEKLIAIVGPTGAGKSALALKLASKFNGEIVSADSRQVYCGLDIGTAKPSSQERSLVPHHLVNVVMPDEDFSLAQYKEMACDTIAGIQQRGRLPLLVGGTGQYVWAVLENWQVPRIAPNISMRQDLQERASRGEQMDLYAKLAAADPQAASSIDPRNIRRVIRALEIVAAGKRKLQVKAEPLFETLIIGLTAPRAELYRRIDARVDGMMASGLVSEVKSLMDQGRSLDLPSMSGIGYKQIGSYLQGTSSLAGAIQQIKTESHRLVRMQYNWFKFSDLRICWLDITSTYNEAAIDLINNFLATT